MSGPCSERVCFVRHDRDTVACFWSNPFVARSDSSAAARFRRPRRHTFRTSALRRWLQLPKYGALRLALPGRMAVGQERACGRLQHPRTRATASNNQIQLNEADNNVGPACRAWSIIVLREIVVGYCAACATVHAGSCSDKGINESSIELDIITCTALILEQNCLLGRVTNCRLLARSPGTGVEHRIRKMSKRRRSLA